MSIDTSIDKEAAYSQLRDILGSMNVPSFRYDKVVWLSKNLATKNKGHRNYEPAMQLITFILKRGWS